MLFILTLREFKTFVEFREPFSLKMVTTFFVLFALYHNLPLRPMNKDVLFHIGFIILLLTLSLGGCYKDPDTTPRLKVTPALVDFEDDTSNTFTIKNIGHQNLNYLIESNSNWIKRLSPNNGELKCNTDFELTVEIDRTKLKAGHNETTLQIKHNGEFVSGGEITLKAFRAVKPSLSLTENDLSELKINTVKATASVIDLGSSNIKEHGYIWSTQPNSLTINSNNSFSNQLGTRTNLGIFETRLTNLKINTTYYIRAYAINEEGIGYSSEVEFKTPDTKFPTAIRLSKTSITEDNSLNALIGTLSTIDPDLSDTHTYTLVSGGTDFNINGDNLQASKSFDFETQNRYTIRIKTEDNKGGTFEQDFTITILDANDNPTQIRLNKSSILENNSLNAVIGNLSTTDQDAGDTHTYTLVSGRADFNINGNNLQASKSFNFETQSSYNIRIRTEDSKGSTFEQGFTITILDANDNPTQITLSKTSIPENNSLNAVIGSLSSTDQDAGDTHTYTLVSGGTDFNINGNNLQASKSFDFETQNSYTIRIRTEDSKGSAFEQNFTITIIDVDEKSFITKWQTTRNNESITIPTVGSGYNYEIDWGDGSRETGKTGNASHTYTTPGIYTVKIAGNFPRIYFNNSSPSAGDNSTKIITIEQWGNIVWASMESAFQGCSNLAGQAKDRPNLSRVTDMGFMFHEATTFNQDIGNWNVANVTNMRRMFSGARAFNQNIGRWNVANVTDMRSMFLGASTFNQDIGGWNVTNVTSMALMFSSARAFNQNIGRWKVANVTNMQSMFRDARAFNQNIGGWNVY